MELQLFFKSVCHQGQHEMHTAQSIILILKYSVSNTIHWCTNVLGQHLYFTKHVLTIKYYGNRLRWRSKSR